MIEVLIVAVLVMWSTLVVFKEGREAARSTGQTRKEALAELLGKAL